MSKGGPEVVDTESKPWEPLIPYLVGEAGPNWGKNPGINYNWMDAADQLGGGMPLSRVPPMFMNDPRLTFKDVHTPYEGGPWGYGLGPGEPTSEAGIPTQPGNYVSSGILDRILGTNSGSGALPPGPTSGGSFVEAPEGLVPDAPYDPLADYEDELAQDNGFGFTPDLLLDAQNYYNQLARQEIDSNEGYGSPYPMNIIMAAMMENPGLSGREMRDAIHQMWLRSRGASI